MHEEFPPRKKSLQEKVHLWALVWWPVIVLLVPIITALVVYANNPNHVYAQLILSFAMITAGVDIVLIAIKRLQAKVEESTARFQTAEDTSVRMLQNALSTPDYAGFRNLLHVMNEIQRSKNPLMKRLANDQVTDLAAFLEKFDTVLPFIRGSELITIEKHYTSFMHTIGLGGEYVATTLPSFWIEEDADILQTFFYSQEESASNGVRIRRVFLLREDDERNPRVRALLVKHARISRKYKSGGSIETRVLQVSHIDPNEDDFGVYLMERKPAAIAMGRFEPSTLRLRGNEVCFDAALLERKYNMFRDRFETGMSIHDYLKGDPAALRQRSIPVGAIAPGAPAS